MKAIDPADLAARWPDRERQWRKELGRIRLGVEPVEVQLERIRRVNLTMMWVCDGIALMFAAIFTAFRHPWIGLAVAASLVLPQAVAWYRFLRLSRRVATYLREREAVMQARDGTANDRGE